MSYGERLKQAMELAKVDRKTLAAKLKITSQAVGQVLAGTTKAFDATNHTKAFQLLDCDPLWLATGYGNPVAPTHHEAREPTPAPWAVALDAIDFARVARLSHEDALRLEGAWLLAAKQLGFDVRKRQAA